MVQCAASGCKADGTHYFPKEEARRKAWIEAVNRDDFKCTQYSRLCSAHFKPEDYITVSYYTGMTAERKVLKKTAVPSIFGLEVISSASNVRPKRRASKRTPAILKRKKRGKGKPEKCEQDLEDVPDVRGEIVLDLSAIRGRECDSAEDTDGSDCDLVEGAVKKASDTVEGVGEEICGMVEETCGMVEETCGMIEETYGLVEGAHESVKGAGEKTCVMEKGAEKTRGKVEGAGRKTCDTVEGAGPVEEMHNSMKNVSPKVTTASVGSQKSYQFFSIENFRKNNEAILFYTGLKTFSKFLFVFNTLCPEVYSINRRYSQILTLPVKDQFFLTLIKMRQNKEDFELSILFGTNRTTVSNVFCVWINFMYQKWSKLDSWPSKELVNFFLSDGHNLNPSTRIIVCSKVPIQVSKKSSPEKKGPRLQNKITLPNLQKENSVSIDIPSSPPSPQKEKSQLPGEAVLRNNVSSGHAHLNKVIGLVKTYKILQVPLEKLYFGFSSKIFSCCHMISNLNEGTVFSSV